jgi:hypothetical protein
MSSMSTPLDAIGEQQAGAPPPADEERVRKILAEMNAGDVVQQPPAMPPPMGPRVITEPPLSMSPGQMRMDVGTARANIIGSSQPTMADFQSMFASASPGMAPFHGPAVVPGPSIPAPAPKASADWKTSLTQQIRSPIAVAIIVFLLNMPVVTAILSRYASWMYLSSGEISVGGLLVKAVLAAFLFGIYQIVTSILDR